MFILGIICSFIMGLVLSLLGAGGSILTMPILVYIFGINAIEATTYSLLLVGLTALMASYVYFKQGTIDIKTAFIFGIPSILGVLIVRQLLLPLIPNSLTFGITITKSFLILFIFACLMFVSGLMMIKDRKPKIDKKNLHQITKIILVIFEGVVVGAITGLVGAGGGFLIIPALVLLAGLDMKIAIGTSLVIIAMKSIIGFGGDLYQGFEVDWIFVFYVLMATTIGVLMGNYISKFFSGPQLKKYFGIMTLFVGFLIIVEQLINLN